VADHQQQIVATPAKEQHKGGAGTLIVVALALGVSVAAWQITSGGSASSQEGLARVDIGDIPGAMTTMAGAPEFLSHFQGESKSCPTPLAWIALARLPGSPGGAVRVHSGSYLSPTFELSDASRRIAIPYPAPYELGSGEISVTGVAGGLVMSLSPSWTVDSLNGTATKPVVWHVSKHCES
jgi:hypothetical protein